MMKIAIVTTLAGPGSQAGGVWSVAKIQAELLRTHGHEVRLVAGWTGTPPTDPDPAFEPIRLLRIPGDQSGRVLLPLSLKMVRAAIIWADIVHIHLCRDLVTMPALSIARAAKASVVAQTHGMLRPANSLWTRAYDAVLGRAYRIPKRWVALTSTESQTLCSLLGPQTEVAVLPNTCLPPQLTWQEPKMPRLVFVSRLHARKQPLAFAKAATLVAKAYPDVKFEIFGEDQGAKKEVVDFLANASSHSISIQGPVSPTKVQEILSTSTAVVLPSLDEPYPMIAIEAAATGTPQIISSQTGLSEILRKTGAAHVVEPDIQSLVVAMEEILQTPSSSLHEMSVRAKEAYATHWHPSRYLARLEQIYDEVLGHNA